MYNTQSSIICNYVSHIIVYHTKLCITHHDYHTKLNHNNTNMTYYLWWLFGPATFATTVSVESLYRTTIFKNKTEINF